MKEEFLHFVWETRSFEGQAWTTLDGAPLQIVHPGEPNYDAGPDFLNAHIRIEDRDHFGHVEIHVDGRDWYRHHHHLDPNYNPVVLHVVFRPSETIPLRQDGTYIPEAVLAERIRPDVLQDVQVFTRIKEKLPCRGMLQDVPRTVSKQWLEQCGQHRFENKANTIEDNLKDPMEDWTQEIWIRLAKALGGKVNGKAFASIASSIPVRIMRRFAFMQDSREAILFGVAGLLEGSPADDYHITLQSEWNYLQRLHNLKVAPISLKFSRMRPAGFPTIRLSQLGALVQTFPQINDLLHPDLYGDFLRSTIQATPYWQDHTHFGRPAKQNPRRIGKSFLKIALINSMIPIGLAYAKAHGRDDLVQRILKFPTLLQPENNRLIRKFEAGGLPITNSMESQGLLHLHENFCTPRRCLSCKIGKSILRPVVAVA